MLGDGDSIEGWSDWWGELGGWGEVSLGAFEMAAVLMLIKFLAAIVTVFDFVILIHGVKRDNLDLMEPSVCKTFSDDCTRRKNSIVCWWDGHPLNCWRGHPLLLLGGGS